MRMITFRITQEKTREYLGKPLEHALSPLKNKRLIMSMLIIALTFIVLAAFLLYSMLALLEPNILLYLTLIFLIIVPFLFSIAQYYLFRLGFIDECVPKMRGLVADPELLWLNVQNPLNTVKKWDRSTKHQLKPVNFKMLAYLKKEKTSQAFYTIEKSMKNSNSSSVAFKRLAERKVFEQPVIRQEGNDYRYIPWQFKMVDRNNKPVNTKEAAIIEDFLKMLWAKLIDNYFNENYGLWLR